MADAGGVYAGIIAELRGYAFGAVKRIILSSPGSGIQKITIRPIKLKGVNFWQFESIANQQAFHENIPAAPAGVFLACLSAALEKYRFRRINVITANSAFQYSITKKGKLIGCGRNGIDSAANVAAQAGGDVLTNPGRADHPSFGAERHSADAERHSVGVERHSADAELSHDRQKKYILAEGTPVLPFVELGVFDANYRIVKSKYDKFRQVNRFVEIIADAEDSIRARTQNGAQFNIIDFGCGKSYLTFFIYHYFTQILKTDVRVSGYDIKEDIVERCNGIAAKYGYDNLKFYAGDVSEIPDLPPGCGKPADMIVALHACDTATDRALYYAIKNRVPLIFSVPCCQHEINARISIEGDLSFMLDHGLFKERFSALLTDAVRCEILKIIGYSVDVAEFVDFGNTPKNVMIRAVLTDLSAARQPADGNTAKPCGFTDSYGFSKPYDSAKQYDLSKFRNLVELLEKYGVTHTLVTLLSGR